MTQARNWPVSSALWQGKAFAGAAIAVLALFRLYLELHTPLLLQPHAGHDDGLFLRLAGSLASGHWLGPFDEFTLMKGPGYPLFIALSSQLGLPLTLSHALLHIAAAGAASWALLRLTGNGVAAFCLYALVLLLPAGLHPELQRVLRDQIYWAECLLVLSGMAVALLAPAPPAPKPGGAFCGLAFASGLALGWTWITREEGFWLVPGLCVLVIGALLAPAHTPLGVRRTLAALLSAGAGLLAILATVCGLNFLQYGTFAANDFQEANFKSALAALQGIDAGARMERVPVSHAAMERAAQVSPAFASVAAHLRSGSPRDPWHAATCKALPHACGEIGGGWFMWALRSAVAKSGAYASPATAAALYAAVAAEIRAACADGRLTCQTSLDAFAPPMPERQWSSALSRLLAAAETTALLTPPTAPPTKGPDVAIDMVEFNWAFLNFPRIVAPADSEGWSVLGRVTGPADASGPRLRILSADGVPLTPPAALLPGDAPPQSGSPAPRRFLLTARCPDGCTLEVEAGNGHTVRLPLSAAIAGAAVEADDARVSIDLVRPREHLGALSAQGVKAVRKTVDGLFAAFGVLFAPLLALGMGVMLIATVRAAATRSCPPVLVLAASAWVLVASRIFMVTLVDLSAFPAVNAVYLAPATYLAAVAAMASLVAAGRPHS